MNYKQRQTIRKSHIGLTFEIRFDAKDYDWQRRDRWRRVATPRVRTAPLAETQGRGDAEPRTSGEGTLMARNAMSMA
jgi:hypothetical protein